MNKASITLTKYQDFFNDRETGQQMQYQYIELELAPNLYAKVSLKPSNLRVIEKYNPDLAQLIHNTPFGYTYTFTEEDQVPEVPKGGSGIGAIYSDNEYSDDEAMDIHKGKKHINIL